MLPSSQRESKKRGKYGRPCDRCATRRIRCLTDEDATACTGCLNSGEKCTRDRIRKKSGPKNGRRSRSLPDQSVEFNETSFLADMNNGHAGHVHTNNVSGSVAFQESGVKKEHPFQAMGNAFEVPQVSPQNMTVYSAAARSSSLSNMLLESPRQMLDLQAHYMASLSPQQQQQQQQQQHLPGFNILHSHQQPMFPSYATMQPHPRHSSQYIQQHLAQPQYSTYPQHPLAPEPLVSQETPPTNETVNVRVDSEHGADITPSDEHEDLLSAFKTSTSPYTARVPLQCLVSCVQVFQTWFYGCWPILSLGDLISEISGGAQTRSGGDFISLNEKNAMSYALCCAVCAATTTQLSFVSPENVALDQSATSNVEYATEAQRVRNLFDYTNKIEVETLLSSFFLYAHYTNQKGKTKQAQMYLREAISMAQILGFHQKSQYSGKSRADVHRWRKIYYTLLVTERYVCFEGGLPVILDPCIPFPELSDEEYPQLLTGFSELIHIFSVPSKEFFFEMNQNRHENMTEEKPIDEKRQWILAVQESLGTSRQLPKNVTNPQKLNILLSKAWIRAIACHITWNNGMLRLSEHSHDCFGFDFPLVNAQEFLMESSYLPNMAFETNGPGICVKLLEMANSLSFTVQQSSNQRVGLSVLESLFGLVNKFKNDVTLPMKVYQGIANLIARHKLKVVPRLIENHDSGYISQHGYQHGTIEELLEEDVGEPPDDSVKDEFTPVELSPNSRSSFDQGIGMLNSVPSFLNVGYHQIDESPSNQR